VSVNTTLPVSPELVEMGVRPSGWSKPDDGAEAGGGQLELKPTESKFQSRNDDRTVATLPVVKPSCAR
jgi:hypothetical protein